MKLLLIVFLFLIGCSNHRIVFMYESGDVAVNGGTDFSTGTSLTKTLEHTNESSKVD